MKVRENGPTAEGTGGVDLSDLDGLRSAWNAHASELVGYAARVLDDRGAADEAVQETFLRAWRAARSFDRSRPLRPWLFAILRNVIIDMARSQQRRAALGAEGSSAAGPADVGIDDARLGRMFDEWMLHEAFRRLRDDQRIVLVEAFYRGRPYAEIAIDLGIPEGTVRSRAFYGLRTLRLVLEEMGWEP